MISSNLLCLDAYQNLSPTQTNVARVRFAIRRRTWVEFVGSLLCTLEVFSGYFDFPFPQKLAFDLICVNCQFQFTVSSISAPALERLDT